MKRTIKFRGLGIDGEIYYGDVYHTRKDVGIHDVEHGSIYEVEPDSIAQLVGYDKDGNEIYEGDTVIDEFGHEVAAKLFDNLELGRVALKEIL